MATYPDDIFEPRVLENVPGHDFDASKTQRIYAEDFNSPEAEIVAIETVLGTTPQGIYSTVKAWLTDLSSALSGKQNALGFTPENVANKDTDGTLAANSDTKYASQKATKTYADTKSPKATSPTNGDIASVDASGDLTDSGKAFDTDGTLAANSDAKIPTQKAVKTYVDGKPAGSFVLVSQGTFSVSVTGSVTTLKSITGLDGNTDGEYLLEAVFDNGGNNCVVGIDCNAGSNFANHWTWTQSYLVAGGSINKATNGGNNTDSIAKLIGNDSDYLSAVSCFLSARIMAKIDSNAGSRHPLILATGEGWDGGSGSLYFTRSAAMNTDTTHNITSIELKAYNSSGTHTMTGSYRLYKLAQS
jgi:hypothetical protein